MKNLILVLGYFVLTGFLVWALLLRPEKDPEIVEHYNYETDTIYVDRPYEVPKPYEVVTPPIVVTEYIVDSTAIKDLLIKIEKDSITILGLEVQLAIHKNYLKQFPENPKLIEALIDRDTLSLTLLDISGLILKEDYPVYFDEYAYQWSSGKLTRKDNKLVQEKPKFLVNIYGGLAFDFFHKSPTASLSIEKKLSSTILFIDYTNVLLDAKGNNLRIGAKYKLNGSKVRF